MPRTRQGSVLKRKDGSVWARVTYIGSDGKRRDLQRRAENRTQAREIIKKLLRELDDVGDRGIDGDRMTFRQLAAEYEERKLFAAEYHGERKVAGLRSWKSSQGFLQTLVTNFGAKRIRDITHADIESYKRKRLKEPVVRKKKVKSKTAEGERKVETVKIELPRSIAGVNRELEVMRSVMRFAKQQKWILISPFEEGSSLISKADETKREKVLSFDEEKRLLEACRGRRAHLRPLIITAVDTAMRRGELFKLQWKDVDFASRTITVTAMNSKTAKARTIAMTPRVHQELSQLAVVAPKDDRCLVFGITDTVKKSFAAACTAAQIDGLRFHDLRHTSITRMVQAGIAPMEVMKISGHTQMVTFARYVNPNYEAVRRAADLLAQFNSANGINNTISKTTKG